MITLSLWGACALYFDSGLCWQGMTLATLYLLFTYVLGWHFRHSGVALMGWMILAALVVVWWLSLKPPVDRRWQRDVARLPWAEVRGDVRNSEHVRALNQRFFTMAHRAFPVAFAGRACDSGCAFAKRTDSQILVFAINHPHHLPDVLLIECGPIAASIFGFPRKFPP